MSNCKQCDKPINSHTGRRPKQYCDEKCRNAYFNAHKPKESIKVTRATYERVVTENTALKLLIKELQNSNPVLDRGNEKILDEIGVYPDVSSYVAPNNPDLIKKLEAEKALITGKSDMSIDMRRKLQKRIDQLKKRLILNANK